MKALPITHKATRSPLKMSDEALVANDQQSYKEFNDVAKDYAKGRKEGIAMTQQKGSQKTAPAGGGTDLKEPPINAKDQAKPATTSFSNFKIPASIK